MDYQHVFAVYKPKGPTSNDVVQAIKRGSGVKKIGHGGTLDPLASGVLIIGVNEGTRLLSSPELKEKEYLAEIKLGENSSTDDEEGVKTAVDVKNKPDMEKIKNAAAKFAGKINQIPPVYSAVKVSGKESYKLARDGKVADLKPRQVEIKEIEVLNYSWPVLNLRVVTGPGVYIRALARDIGRDLGTGGYITELERTRVGGFKKEDALPVSEIVQKLENKPESCYTSPKMITIDEFKKAEIKIGKVISAERIEGADKLLKLTFDVGESEPRQVLSGIAETFPEPEVLIGKEIPVLLNIEPREMRGLTSYGMIIAADIDGKAVLLTPENEVSPGTEVK